MFTFVLHLLTWLFVLSNCEFCLFVAAFYFSTTHSASTLRHDSVKKQCWTWFCWTYVPLDSQISGHVWRGNVLHLCHRACCSLLYSCHRSVAFSYNPRCWSYWLKLLPDFIDMQYLEFLLPFDFGSHVNCTYWALKSFEAHFCHVGYMSSHWKVSRMHISHCLLTVLQCNPMKMNACIFLITSPILLVKVTVIYTTGIYYAPPHRRGH